MQCLVQILNTPGIFSDFVKQKVVGIFLGFYVKNLHKTEGKVCKVLKNISQSKAKQCSIYLYVTLDTLNTVKSVSTNSEDLHD